MEIEKPILMGHSMGSGTVMRVAAAYPDLPRAAVLLDPGMGPRRADRGPAAPRGEAPTAAAGRPLRMGGSPEEMVAQNNRPFDELVAQCRQQTPKWDLLDCEYWAVSKRLYHGSYTSGGTGTGGSASYISNLGKITVPTLLLKADAPPEARKANEEFVKGMKHVKLVHIDGAGHNLHHDERQQTLKVMREFLGAL
jgi:pimeloyl-ACP methyl ester carboxylesterase